MIISISGCQSCGKTTVLNELKQYADKLSDHFQMPVQFNEENARQLWLSTWASKVARFEDIFSDPFLALEYEQDLIAQYTEARRNNENKLIISDRCELDILVYTMMNCDPAQPKYASVINACRQLRAIDNPVIFIATHLGFLEQDGMRPLMSESRVASEIAMFKMVSEGYHRRHILPTDRKERISYILHTLTDSYA